MPAIMLRVYENNKKTPYHITIAMLTSKANPVTIKHEIIKKFGAYFNEQYKLQFVQQWGKNSILTKSWDTKTNIDLETIRLEIFNFINEKYPKCIGTERYNSTTWIKYTDSYSVAGIKTIPPDGFSPQHINVYGNMDLVGKIIDVTFVLE